MFSMFSMYLGMPKVAYERPKGLSTGIDSYIVPEQNIVNTLGMMFRMYCILYAISVHYEHHSGQNKNNDCTLFPPKNREKIHIFSPSCRVFTP